jgi:hypothetical protein
MNREPTDDDVERTKLAHDQIGRVLAILDENDHQLRGFIIANVMAAWIAKYPVDQEEDALESILLSVREIAEDLREQEERDWEREAPFR